MSGVTSYEELGDRFKAAFDRIKRADASFPESVLQEFPLVLSDLDVERIAVSQGWQDEFLRPATPPPAAPSRNIQEFIRRQQQQQVAVPTPARAAPPGPVRQAPPSAVRMSIASVASPASIGRPSIASPAAEPAAPAAVSKAAPPAPPAALPAQPAAPAALPAQPAAPAPLPAAPAALPADPAALPADPAALPADPVPEEIPAPAKVFLLMMMIMHWYAPFAKILFGLVIVWGNLIAHIAFMMNAWKGGSVWQGTTP